MRKQAEGSGVKREKKDSRRVVKRKRKKNR